MKSDDKVAAQYLMNFKKLVAHLLIVCIVLGSSPLPAKAGEAWLSSPANGAVVSGKFEISAGFQSSTNKPVTYVVVQIDGKELGTRALSSPSIEGVLSFSWDTTSLKDGLHGIGLFFYSGQQQVAKAYVKVEVRNGSSTITGGSQPDSGLNKGSAKIRLEGIRDGETISGKRSVHVVPANALGNDLFVSVTANGKLKYLSNRAPYEFSLNTEEYADGPLELEVKVKNTNQDQLASYPVRVNVQNQPGLVEEVRQLAKQSMDIIVPREDPEAYRLSIPPAANVSKPQASSTAGRTPEPRQPAAANTTNIATPKPSPKKPAVIKPQPQKANQSIAKAVAPAKQVTSESKAKPVTKPAEPKQTKPEKPVAVAVRTPQIEDAVAKQQAPEIVKAETTQEPQKPVIPPIESPRLQASLSLPPAPKAKTTGLPELSVKPEIESDPAPVKPVEMAKLPEPELSLVEVNLPTRSEEKDSEAMAAVRKPVPTAPPAKQAPQSDSTVSAPVLSAVVPTPAGKPEYMDDSLATIVPNIEEDMNPVTPSAPAATQPVKIQPVRPVVMAKAEKPAQEPAKAEAVRQASPVVKPEAKKVEARPVAPEAAKPTVDSKPKTVNQPVTKPAQKVNVSKPVVAKKTSQGNPKTALAPRTTKPPVVKPTPSAPVTPSFKTTVEMVKIQASVHGGRAIVSLRESVQKLGGKVWWDHQTKVVTATLNNRTIRIYTRSHTIIGDQVAKQSVDTFIRDGRTLLPARLLEAAWGLDLRWDSRTRTISVVPFRKPAPAESKDRSV